MGKYKMPKIKPAIQLHKTLKAFCKQYAHKTKGDCYDCPIGARIAGYCEINQADRFLTQIINNEKLRKRGKKKFAE